METLKLQKMGCDFWENSKEIENSDLENFRLWMFLPVKIKENQKENSLIHVEITNRFFDKHVAWKDKKNFMTTFFEVSYMDENNQEWRVSKRCDTIFNNSNKKMILEWVKKNFNLEYSNVEIIDRKAEIK